jgi:hypothetical protein
VGAILSALAVLWIYAPTGYGDDFVAALEQLCGGNQLVTNPTPIPEPKPKPKPEPDP